MTGINFETSIARQEFWSSVGYWILVIGLIGEVCVYGIPKHSEALEKLLGVLFTVVIIIGLAIEHRADKQIAVLVSLERSSAALQIADAQKAAGAANALAEGLAASTATLKKEAELERLKRVEIEERVEWRRLNEEQQREIATSLSLYTGETGSVWFDAVDVEANTFAADIASALRLAHWTVVGPASFVTLIGSLSNSPPLATGATIASTADQNSTRAAASLLRALRAFGFDCTPSDHPPIPGPVPTLPTVFVSVESRPLGPQGNAKLHGVK